MLVAGIDIGTSAVKAGLFDLSGRQLAGAYQEYCLESSQPDRVEVDPEIYWEKAREALMALLRSGTSPAEVAAIGITSQGETLITLDQTGKPTGKAIVWLDTRAIEQAREIQARFGLDRIYRVTGQNEVCPGYTACLIRWLKEHQPERFSQTDKFLLVTDYLVYKLTGVVASSKGLYPSTLYYDVGQERWWPEMLEFLEVQTRQLPVLLDAGTAAGRLSNRQLPFSPNTLVCPAPIDQVTAALGSGNLQSGTASEATGTALALCAVSSRPVFDRKKRFGFFPHAVTGRYLAMPWAPASGSILSWFKNQFFTGRNYQELTEEASRVAPGCDGLILLPHFCGMVCPEKLTAARGVFWGLTLQHQRPHFIRAIMEAVAYLLRDYLNLLEENGIVIEKIISLGGASKNAFWCQIKADVCGKMVASCFLEEAGCLGAAMVAATAAGVFPDCETACLAMARTGQVYHPDPARTAVYQELYRNYRKLNEGARPLFLEVNHG